MTARLPWKPLEEALTAYFNGLPIHHSHCICISGGPRGSNLRGGCWNFLQAGEAVEVARETISYWRRADSVPFKQADKVAVRLGRMPWEIWPEWNAIMDERAFRGKKISVPEFV